MSKTATAVQWLLSQVDVPEHIRNRALLLERQQHGNTWNAAIQAHEDRGHNTARSIPDFDEYQIQ